MPASECSTGAMACARSTALAWRSALMAGSRGPPSLTPRSLAAARPARVRSAIISRSCSATAARMWIDETVCVRHVAADEIDFGLHQAGDEMHIPSQTIELADHKPRPVLLTRRDRLREFGAILAPPDSPRQIPRRVAMSRRSGSLRPLGAGRRCRNHFRPACRWRRAGRRQIFPARHPPVRHANERMSVTVGGSLSICVPLSHQLPSPCFQHRRAASARKAAPCSTVNGTQPQDLDVPSASAATATWRTLPQEHRQPARRPVASSPRTSQAPNCCPMVTVMNLGGLGASRGCFWRLRPDH